MLRKNEYDPYGNISFSIDINGTKKNINKFQKAFKTFFEKMDDIEIIESIIEEDTGSLYLEAETPVYRESNGKWKGQYPFTEAEFKNWINDLCESTNVELNFCYYEGVLYEFHYDEDDPNCDPDEVTWDWTSEVQYFYNN